MRNVEIIEASQDKLFFSEFQELQHGASSYLIIRNAEMPK
jgi:hypothetical protein